MTLCRLAIVALPLRCFETLQTSWLVSQMLLKPFYESHRIETIELNEWKRFPKLAHVQTNHGDLQWKTWTWILYSFWYVARVADLSNCLPILESRESQKATHNPLFEGIILSRCALVERFLRNMKNAAREPEFKDFFMFNEWSVKERPLFQWNIIYLLWIYVKEGRMKKIQTQDIFLKTYYTSYEIG